jgi:hypothetical protein
MGRVLRFTRPHNAPTPEARYPRFTEVTAHISHLADEFFGAPRTLEEGVRIYRDLEQRLSPPEREQLARFYRAIIEHEEKFEHAAYLVGLLAGSGQLLEGSVFVDERTTAGEKS